MPSAAPCAHCGLPVPPGLLEPAAEHQFCCNGCRTAYQVIHEAGLERYYRLRADTDAPEQPATTSGAGFADLDDPALLELYASSEPDGDRAIELYLEGVHCAACVWLVERLPAVVDGVRECRLDLGRSVATVRWDPATVPLSTAARFLDRIGYRPHPFRGREARELERREERAMLLRLGVAGAIAGNVMLLAFALYGGAFHGIEPVYARLFRVVSALLATPAVAWCALPFLRGAWGALATRRAHMDLPIAVGLLAGYLGGVVNTIRGTGEVYFDSVTVLVFLLLAGRHLQRRQQRRAARAAELLAALTPTAARLIDGETVREVAVAALAAGDLVEVRPGESIPVDGVVEAGRSTVDRSLLTGESVPEPVAPGAPVHAGTSNVLAPLRVRVGRTGAETRLGRLMTLVEDAARRRAPVVRLADRLSGVFVTVVLGLAVVTLIGWSLRDPAHALEHTIALLIVACPCALGLATPLAVAAAIGRAASAGILIKGGDALEALARPGHIVLDKTGTLTEGRLRLVEWHGDETLRPLVATVEAQVAHPVAAALAAGLAIPDSPTPTVTDLALHGGRGVTARCDGVDLVVGSPPFVLAQAADPGDHWQIEARTLAEAGMTPVLVAAHGEVRAAAGLSDPLCPEAAAAVGALLAGGWTVEVLSGDAPATVEATVRSLGLDGVTARGGTTPEAKAERIRELAERGPVVMVGDGVNDAAALAGATVGVAVHGGAEAAMAAADVYLTTPGLAGLEELLEGAAKTMAVIRRNIAFSLVYNVVAVGLAMAGLMHPIAAALLMPASSLTVVASSYRARTFGGRKQLNRRLGSTTPPEGSSAAAGGNLGP